MRRMKGTYGPVDLYLEKELGFTQEKRGNLRNLLLE
ncbi:hypothetical protein [Brevibacillus choshinensis]